MHTIRTTAALAVASGVAVASFAAPAAAHPGAASATPTTKSPAAAAAGFLARQLVKHKDHFLYPGTTYVDDGDTADAILSMDAGGYAQNEAARATKWLEGDAANYAYSSSTGSQPYGWYPGSTAKLLLVAEAQHVNPEKFGTTDLIGALIGDEGAGGASPGEFQNPEDLSYGSSVLDQALAVLALSNTTAVSGQPDAAAVSFLAGQQCTDGEFQYSVRADTATDCTDKGDTDTTAYAVQALIAGGDRGSARAAISWLQTHENSNGGWPASGAKTSNANSTAIAVEALLDAHKSAAKGLAWLAKEQLGCGIKAADRGAVAYSGKPTAYDSGKDVKATAQAGAALAGKPLAWIDKQGAHGAAPALACPKPKKK